MLLNGKESRALALESRGKRVVVIGWTPFASALARHAGEHCIHLDSSVPMEELIANAQKMRADLIFCVHPGAMVYLLGGECDCMGLEACCEECGGRGYLPA